MNSLKDLDKFPPCLCRAVARTASGKKSLTNTEIARRSGLSRITVIRISKKASWLGLSLASIIAFTDACGVNLLRPSRQIDYLKRRKKVAMGPRQLGLLKNLRAASQMTQ